MKNLNRNQSNIQIEHDKSLLHESQTLCQRETALRNGRRKADEGNKVGKECVKSDGILYETAGGRGLSKSKFSHSLSIYLLSNLVKGSRFMSVPWSVYDILLCCSKILRLVFFVIEPQTFQYGWNRSLSLTNTVTVVTTEKAAVESV